MKKWICMLLCVALGACPACLGGALADAGEDDGWLVSEPFVARVATVRPAIAEAQAQGEAPELFEEPVDGLPAGEADPAQTPDPPRAGQKSVKLDAAPAQPRAAERPDLDQALSFWQDGAPDLRYRWDAGAGMWSAEPMEPEAFAIYVVNNDAQTVGPFAVTAAETSAVDQGGLFRLEARLLDAASGLTLQSGASARVGDYIFSGTGGLTDTAFGGVLVIELGAKYLD